MKTRYIRDQRGSWDCTLALFDTFFFFVSLQNCIATHESNGIDIIIALILNDINPLGKKRMDLVLELKVSEGEERSTSLCETGEWG